MAHFPFGKIHFGTIFPCFHPWPVHSWAKFKKKVTLYCFIIESTGHAFRFQLNCVHVDAYSQWPFSYTLAFCVILATMYVRSDVPFMTSWFINYAFENAKNGRIFKKCSRFMKSVVNGAVKQDFMIICTNNQLISISWGLLKHVRTTLNESYSELRNDFL